MGHAIAAYAGAANATVALGRDTARCCLVNGKPRCRDAARTGAPARNQPGEIAALQAGQIDRQQQHGTRETRVRNGTTHGTRQALGAPQIGDKCHVQSPRFDPVTRCMSRQHDQDFIARERSDCLQGPAQ